MRRLLNIIVLVLIGAVIFIQSSFAQARSFSRFALEVASFIQTNVAKGSEGQSPMAVGIGINGTLFLSKIYGLGLAFDNTWYVPRFNAEEFNVLQQDLLIVNRFRLISRRWIEFSIDLSGGITLYKGMVDIPLSADPAMPCWGCGRYGGTTLHPSIQMSGNYLLPINNYFFLTAAVQLSGNMTFVYATDNHNFIPPFLSMRFFVGLGGRY
jgi:hypothetical protein